MFTRRHIGHGIGLRTEHYADVLAQRPDVGFFEIISENFLVAGGNPRRVVRAVAERWPIVMHGVSMSLGATDPLDVGYLRRLRGLADELQAAWVSDHLAWTSLGGRTVHDLWPLPYTEESLAHLVARVQHAQERLGRQILIENPSSYLTFKGSTIPEWEFLSALAEQADCGLLLDVNNIYVSAKNHGFDAQAFLAGISAERVGQIHLAGHTDLGTHLLDTHDHEVCDDVWALYRDATRRVGAVSTLIERDDRIPPLAAVVAESQQAARIEADVLAEARDADAA